MLARRDQMARRSGHPDQYPTSAKASQLQAKLIVFVHACFVIRLSPIEPGDAVHYVGADCAANPARWERRTHGPAEDRTIARSLGHFNLLIPPAPARNRKRGEWGKGG